MRRGETPSMQLLSSFMEVQFMGEKDTLVVHGEQRFKGTSVENANNFVSGEEVADRCNREFSGFMAKKPGIRERETTYSDMEFTSCIEDT
ncbi:hypothetical protein TanjilG_19400 [Lupinus angustifolius]|uniref:Uncharacterized protein n=1 Tax=Lupinus angustifolius TaxID=3871 RepID=A0A4P1R4T1_LUPAN|nr:hypothetical protein TanjilG_19400 [Lupinus angustifolius]